MPNDNSLKTRMLLVAFPPILPKRPQTLILGTMPGRKSLEKNQYYAHPQNQFWKLMGDIYGAELSLSYEDSLRILKEKHVAVWDVLKACTREGSMDADIKNAEVNDFEAFYQEYPSIRLVIFAGGKAEEIYNKQVLPTLIRDLEYLRVPSPSPAYASMTYAAKLAQWSDALRKEEALPYFDEAAASDYVWTKARQMEEKYPQ